MLPFTITSVAHVIQAAVAPVFLITGVGSMLAVLTNRLARAVDRVRVLEPLLAVADQAGRDRMLKELASQGERMRLIHRAISLCTTCALLICLVVALLFLGEVMAVDFSRLIALLFVVAMGLMIAGLWYFLREIQVATALLRVEIDLPAKQP